MYPKRSKAVLFAGRVIYVTIWDGRGLAIVDSERQEGITTKQVRTWLAHKNIEIVLYHQYLLPEEPKSFKQVGLAVRGYAAFLEPRLKRPEALDAYPHEQYPIDDISFFMDDYVHDDLANYTWQDWIADNQPPNLYDDHDGQLDPARPKFPIVNYTKPDDDEDGP